MKTLLKKLKIVCLCPTCGDMYLISVEAPSTDNMFHKHVCVPCTEKMEHQLDSPKMEYA